MVCVSIFRAPPPHPPPATIGYTPSLLRLVPPPPFPPLFVLFHHHCLPFHHFHFHLTPFFISSWHLRSYSASDDPSSIPFTFSPPPPPIPSPFSNPYFVPVSYSLDPSPTPPSQRRLSFPPLYCPSFASFCRRNVSFLFPSCGLVLAVSVRLYCTSSCIQQSEKINPGDKPNVNFIESSPKKENKTGRQGDSFFSTYNVWSCSPYSLHNRFLGVFLWRFHPFFDEYLCYIHSLLCCAPFECSMQSSCKAEPNV